MPDAPAAAKRSWHRLYYALGAFNVVSVLVAIALGYAAMAGFSTSFDVNARWADRVGAYPELAQAAARANAPGNDVFASGDVEREAARLRSLHADFDRRYIEARCGSLRIPPVAFGESSLRQLCTRTLARSQVEKVSPPRRGNTTTAAASALCHPLRTPTPLA